MSTTQLPHENRDVLYLTDGGQETCLIFHDGLELREFAAFELVLTDEGRQALSKYARNYIALAAKANTSFVLETHTWRASPDWLEKLGYTKPDDMDRIAQASVDLLKETAAEFPDVPVIFCGNIGPRADGYVVGHIQSPQEAQEYHHHLIQALQKAGVDMISAFTLNYVAEAIGMVRAAKACGIPIQIAFTLETDGSLPSGESLGEAIAAVDAATDSYPSYYMINCAHPTHFLPTLEQDAAGASGDEFNWRFRIGGVRANASKCSHAELDEAEELDDGNPEELGSEYCSMLGLLPHANVFGGCCGTDHRHVQSICSCCAPAFRKKQEAATINGKE